VLKNSYPAADGAAASNDVIEEPPHYRALPYRRRIRLAVSLFYFCQGLAFASWASRIPDIKTALQLSEAQLGSLLFALPAGQLMTMALSGKLVTTFGSSKVLRLAA